MTALAEKLTVEEMVQHPEKWENFELYRGEMNILNSYQQFQYKSFG
jgi:hypothetical protein